MYTSTGTYSEKKTPLNFGVKANHLGNVLVTVSDRKIPHETSTGIIEFYSADIVSAADLYPFGMEMPGRNYNPDKYKFGFDGMLKDDEIYGSGNSYDFGARLYDPRINRIPTPDPLTSKFPSESPYIFAGDNPLYYIDAKGEYKIPTALVEQYKKDYPMVMKYIESQVKKDVMGSQKILNGFLVSSDNNFTKEKVEEAVTYGSGPNLEFVENPSGNVWSDSKNNHGHYDSDVNLIELNTADVKKLETTLQSDASAENKQAAFMGVYKTLLHETAHYGNTNQESTSIPKKEYNPYVEAGYSLENAVWGSSVYQAPESNMYDENTAKNVVTQQKIYGGEDEKTLPTIPKK